MTGLPVAVPEPGMPETVTFYEVGPRDGRQAEKITLDISTEIELIRGLVATGLSGRVHRHGLLCRVRSGQNVVRAAEG